MSRKPQRGVTLIEMMVVVTLIAIMAGISYPSLATGIDGLRLNAASDTVVAFLNQGLTRVERRQQVLELMIRKADRALYLVSADNSFQRRLDLPEGIRIVSVLPEVPDPELPRRFLLVPGGTVPHIVIQLSSQRGQQRLVRVDPITGVPQSVRLEPAS